MPAALLPDLSHCSGIAMARSHRLQSVTVDNRHHGLPSSPRRST
ncbi:hypothetical protein HMPREF9057_01318 [Actinomyces sp. oral taxon 171 str. F0337]|nr:hypothetical protein HMPREF9057_01318 [Actinomyces sp. oral taxon 171 str. F0337]